METVMSIDDNAKHRQDEESGVIVDGIVVACLVCLGSPGGYPLHVNAFTHCNSLMNSFTAITEHPF